MDFQMLKLKNLFSSAIALLIIFVIMLQSCDDTIDPFIENQASYSIYGMLAVFQDSNYIRIKDLSAPLLADSTREIDAAVMLENLKTGRSQVLQDSVVQFKGVYTHNFLTKMDIQSNTHYRITVKNSSGYSISEVAYVPPIAEVSIVNANAVDQSCYANVSIKFSPVSEDVVFWYAYTLQPHGVDPTYFCKVWIDGKKYVFRNRLCPTPGLYNDDGDYLGARTITLSKSFATVNDTLCGFGVKWRHYGLDAFDVVITKDSLKILGGSGQFGGLYKKEVSITFDPDD